MPDAPPKWLDLTAPRPLPSLRSSPTPRPQVCDQPCSTAHAAGLAALHPVLLAVPPVPLALKMRALRNATGLPADRVAGMVTVYMFPKEAKALGL